MKMRLLYTAKKTPHAVEDMITEYQERLRRFGFDIELIRIDPSTISDEQKSRDIESEAILGKLAPQDYVVLLDERGTLLTSKELANKAVNIMLSGRPPVLIIGGAYGVNEALRSRAEFIWSLSPLVLPHQLARLIVIEQLYRAACINAGHPYHHE